MTREEIMDELKRLGFAVIAKDIDKNGITEPAIVVSSGDSVCPVFYVHKLEEVTDDAREAAARITKLLHASEPSFDPDLLTNKDFILDNISIAAQRISDDEDIVKRDSQFEGIEEYLMVIIPNYSFKVKKDLLDSMGIDEQLAWEKALNNLKLHTRRVNLEHMFGILGTKSAPVFVLTNDVQYKGAAAYLNDDLIRNIAREYNVERLWMIPSSIHEVLIKPDSDDIVKESLDEVVRTVNSTDAVSPYEILSDQAYVIDVTPAMKVSEFLNLNIDVDVADDYDEKVCVAFCGPQKLTEEGKKRYADVLSMDIDYIPEEFTAILHADSEKQTELASEMFEYMAGYCSEKTWNSLFEEE